MRSPRSAQRRRTPPSVLRSGPSSPRFATSLDWASARRNRRPGRGRPASPATPSLLERCIKPRASAGRCHRPARPTAARPVQPHGNRQKAPRLLGAGRPRRRHPQLRNTQILAGHLGGRHAALRESTARGIESRLRRFGNPPRSQVLGRPVLIAALRSAAASKRVDCERRLASVASKDDRHKRARRQTAPTRVAAVRLADVHDPFGRNDLAVDALAGIYAAIVSAHVDAESAARPRVRLADGGCKPLRTPNRARCFGSVNILKTSSRGASNMRVTTRTRSSDVLASIVSVMGLVLSCHGRLPSFAGRERATAFKAPRRSSMARRSDRRACRSARKRRSWSTASAPARRRPRKQTAARPRHHWAP